MAAFSDSFATVLGLLFTLGTAGWILYKFLENCQDSANGLTIGESLARQEAKALAKQEQRRQTAVRARQDGETSAARSGRSGTPLASQYVRDSLSCPVNVMSVSADAHQQEFVAENDNGDLAAFKFYPKVVYRCPYAAESHFKVLHPKEAAAAAAPVLSTQEVYEAKTRKTG